MAYFVAKELHLRPREVLENWTCEELLVAYAHYANQKTQESFEMLDKKERAKKKMTELDRWAMPFITELQVQQLTSPEPKQETSPDEMAKVADLIFGN